MSGTGPGPSKPELVGRDAEMVRLADLARRAAAGQGAVVLIEGEPGIGKTGSAARPASCRSCWPARSAAGPAGPMWRP